MHSDDVGVVEGGHDLNLPPDVDKVLLILDFVFPDGFDGHLWMSTEGAVNSQRGKFPPPLPNLGRGSQRRSRPRSFPTCRTRELSSAAPWKQLPEKRILSIWGLSFPIPAAARTGEAPPEGHRRQLLISGGSPSLLPQVAQPCSSFWGALCGLYPASGARPAAGMCPARMAREITTTTTAHSWGQESGEKTPPTPRVLFAPKPLCFQEQEKVRIQKLIPARDGVGEPAFSRLSFGFSSSPPQGG